MKECFVLLLSLFLFLPCRAVQDFTFTHLNDMYGISMREITAVVRDQDGFIWAASHTGILRVAGDDHRHYDLPLATTDVMQVKLACRGSLLVATTQNGQVYRYNRIRNKFEQWFTLSSVLGNDNWVTNVLIDAEQKVWISTNTGIYLWTGKEVRLAGTDKTGFSNMISLDNGQILAFVESSVYRIDTKTRTFTQLNGHLPRLISSTRYDARKRRVWIGTYNAGLWQYELTGQRTRQVNVPQLPKLVVRDILLTDTASVWVGIDGGGIWILDAGTERVRQVISDNPDNPSSLRGNSVYSLLEDERHRIWVATNSGGLQYTEAPDTEVEHLVHGINNPQSLPNNEVNHLETDSRGNLWIATSDGISLYDTHTRQWKRLHGGSQEIFLSLTSDKKGHLYAGTYGKGVYVFDEASGRESHHYTERDGDLFGVGGFVFATYLDSEGDVWFGGVKDKVYCRRSTDGRMRAYDSQPVYCLSELSPGQILLGCAYGLLLLDKKTGRFDMLLSGCTIHDIAVSGRMIWVCTSGDGVIGLDMNTAGQTRITTQQGLPSNYTKSISLVGDDLWIGTDKGLCCYHSSDKRIRIFGSRQQLANAAFSINATCNLPDGRLAFGSNNGIFIFHPEVLDNSRAAGRIYFSDIRVSGRSIREMEDFRLAVPIDSLSTLHLGYPQTSFTLSVLPLGNLSKSAALSWKLVGQDDTWSTYTTNRYINYTNLPAGHYTLSIRLYDGSLLSERQLSIIVDPPCWQTAWFRLAVAAVVIAILVFGIRYYLQLLHRRYSDEKIRFFTRMSHDIRTSLMLIKAPIEELLKEKNLSTWGTECLKMASEQSSRLSDTATQLLDFEKLDLGEEQPSFTDLELVGLIKRRVGIHASYAAGQQISISVDCIPEAYWVQADTRMLESVLDNLLSNAVKYSPSGGSIEVSFIGKASEWTLRVKDHGMGISKTGQHKLFQEFYRSDNAVNSRIIGSGIGLLMTQKYLRIHDGKIHVTSELGIGTAFDITVPLRPASKAAGLLIPEKVEPAATEGAEAHDMTVLIVEDNQTLCEFMRGALQAQFRVATAYDGQQAWEMMTDLQPDLVVSDIAMPRMDGFELCRNIKSTYETSHIPVILLTALSDKTNQLHGLGLGADNYLVKPFDMELLVSRITSIIRNRRTVLQKAIETKHDDVRSIVTNRINDEFIKKAVECVRANIANEKFSKEDFASALAMSQSLLYKKIKALTNLSVVEFIRSIRLNYALEKLRSGEYNVTEVSEMCGFSTSAYFSKVFKEYFGKTPTEMIQNPDL